MMVTESTSPSSAATVRLMPSIAMDPLNTRNGSSSAGTRMRSHQFSSPSDSIPRNSPVPSTWPCTMWPLRRPVGASGRSRFTREPARNAARLLRRSVSGARSAWKASGRKSTAVRHTPFTAMLAPSVRSWRTVPQRTLSRAPAARVSTDSTVPNSSTIPVNIPVSFHRKFIRRDGMQGHVVNADSVGAPAPPDAAGQRQRFQAAQNLGTVVKEDAVHRARFQRAPVHLAAGFDHQRQVLPAAQPFDDTAQIGAPIGPVEAEDFDAAFFERLAPLG